MLRFQHSFRSHLIISHLRHTQLSQAKVCMYMLTLEGMVLTHLPELQKRLIGSTKEVSHKGAALLQQEAGVKQEPLSVQEYQFNGKPLRNAEHHSFLVEAKETQSSGPHQNQGCDPNRHIRKVSLFSAAEKQEGVKYVKNTEERCSRMCIDF